jgi:hypothetical protein
VLDRLDAAFVTAEADSDQELCLALSASAAAFMLADWGQFTGWRSWIKRFEASDAAVPPEVDASISLARATGATACALLRGGDSDSLRPLGQGLEALISLPDRLDSTQLVLAAAALLPWLQMSKNPAAAQVLHGRMASSIGYSKLTAPGLQYLHAAWLNAWAQHLHFSGDRARLPEALLALDEYLEATPLTLMNFRRARLAAEQALYVQDTDEAERQLRSMLNALHAKRPMERVIYNMLAGAVASLRHDSDRALLHVTHNLRDLEAADCPPSIAGIYRMAATRVYLARANYGEAAAIYGQCVQDAHTAHAAIYRGYEQLANALLLHQQGNASHQVLCGHLRSGLATVRGIPAVNFFFTAPVARATVCALALREGIEVDFVRAALQESPVPPPVWADEHWPWAMSLRCFGGFRSVGLAEEGRASSRASNRPSALLMLIAAHGKQGVPVASATDALWPGQDGDQAENALSVTLLRLRRLYAEADLIERRGGWLHLNPLRVWTDVAALEAHLDALPDRSALVGEADRLGFIGRLFDLYRGDCLMGIDEEWANRRCTHYRGRVTLATQRVLQESLRDNQSAVVEMAITRAFERGLDVARLLAAIHPGERGTPAWARLQQCVELLKTS